MFDTPAKRVRENIARAKSSLHKGEVPKALHAALDGVQEMKTAKIFGREKFEVEVHLQEFLKDFNRHPDVKQYYVSRNVHVTPYVKFDRGGEAVVIEAFEKVLFDLEHKEEQAEQEAQDQRLRRKEEMLEKAQLSLDRQEFPKGKSLVRHIVEEFGNEEGVLTDCGERLLKAGLYFEAGEILEQAVEQNPRDSHALAYAVKAYKNAREYPKMEKLYKFAIKTYGSHPRTLLHMAEMYMDWHKYDEAYDFAKQAYEADDSLEKAKEIVDKMGKRIFS